jgi:hypothetical protein
VALSNESKRLDLPTLTTVPLRLKGYFRPLSHRADRDSKTVRVVLDSLAKAHGIPAVIQ